MPNLITLITTPIFLSAKKKTSTAEYEYPPAGRYISSSEQRLVDLKYHRYAEAMQTNAKKQARCIIEEEREASNSSSLPETDTYGEKEAKARAQQQPRRKREMHAELFPWAAALKDNTRLAAKDEGERERGREKRGRKSMRRCICVVWLTSRRGERSYARFREEQLA